MDGFVSTIRCISSTMCFVSTLSDFRNLRLAGILKKRFLTLKLVPIAAATGSCDLTLEAAIGKDVDLVQEGSLLPFAAKTADEDKILIYERAN